MSSGIGGSAGRCCNHQCSGPHGIPNLNDKTERFVPGAEEECLDGDDPGLVLLCHLEEMLVVESLVFGGELLRRRRRQGRGRGRCPVVLGAEVVPPRGRGRRREYGGKGAEEREAMRRRRREAARADEEEREGAWPG